MTKKTCKKCEEKETHLTLITEQGKRAVADLANYKRRVLEDQKNFVEYANGRLLAELLPILDNFKRAIQHMPEEIGDFEKGIVQIYDHFETTLEKTGLKLIDAGCGTVFDPNLHEALMQGPGEQGKITEELEKGYLLGDKVLRPAKVKVGDGTQIND